MRRAILSICYQIIVALIALASGLVPAAAQTSDPTQGAHAVTPLSCSPAPCVLPPTQASGGPNADLNAPIAVNPANPANLIVGSDDYNCSRDESVGFYLSSDAGSAWSQVCMSSAIYNGQEYIPSNGPILGYDHNGVTYIGGFYIDASGQSTFGFEAFEKSSDGITWSAAAPAVIRQDYDPFYCWMAVDTSMTSPYTNSIYVSCVMDGPIDNNDKTNQVVVSHSSDGGTTWQQANLAPAQRGSIAEDLNTAMTVGNDGTVYVTWMYCYSNPNECNNEKGYTLFSKSSDGGSTWTTPKLVAEVALAQRLPNTQIGVQNTPAIGVDNSNGPHAGNLYVVMYNWTGTFMQVQVVHSTDGGSTWSKPVPVAPGVTHDQFFPWISVSPAGLVGVSWLDRRNDPNNLDYQAFAGISTDGGLSYRNVQLTQAFSDPNVGGGFEIGQYTGNTWDGSNYFVAAWMDESNGVNTQDEVGGIRLK